MADLESYFNPIPYLMFMERLKYKSSILQLQTTETETLNKVSSWNPVSETRFHELGEAIFFKNKFYTNV